MRDVDLGVAGDAPDGLDLAVVLIRPDERHRRERFTGFAAFVGEQPLGRVHALLGRVGPVLEPHELAVEQRVGPARDVARRDHAGRGEAGLVAQRHRRRG